MKQNHRILLLVLVVLLGVNLACGTSTSGQLSDAAKRSTQDAVEPTLSESQSTLVATPAKPTIPTNTTQPTPVPQELTLSDQIAVVQESIRASAIFLVENPNEKLALDRSEYQVTFYDSAGSTLKTETGYINTIFPGEKLGVFVATYLEEGQKAAKADVQISNGSPALVEITGSPFTIDKATFLPDDNFPKASGVIQNLLDVDLTELQLTAVLYDDAGAIVGGGYTYLNFVPAKGQTGADVSVLVSGKPAKVELYLTPTSLSVIEQKEVVTNSISLGDQGFAQNRTQVGVAYFVSSSEMQRSVENTLYRVSAYADDGSVLGTDSGYITFVLPGEKLGNYAELSVPDGKKVANVVIQVKSGDSKDVNISQNPFSVDNVKFQASNLFPKVTGVISNGLNMDVTEMKVNAMAYDADGKILGGGFTYVDFLPASGQAAVEVSTTISGAPAKWELYPTLSGLSIFEEGATTSAALKLVSQGFSQVRTEVGVGFLVQNTDSQLPMDGAQFQIAAYDDAGDVLATDSGYFGLVFPGEKVAGYSSLYLPEGKKASRVEVQIKQGDLEPSSLSASPFTTDQAKYIPDSYFPKINGLIISSLDKEVSNIEVIAIAYNEAGEIIGGGFTYVDFVPANGQTAADVSVVVDGKPAKVELYATLSNLSTIGD